VCKKCDTTQALRLKCVICNILYDYTTSYYYEKLRLRSELTESTQPNPRIKRLEIKFIIF